MPVEKAAIWVLLNDSQLLKAEGNAECRRKPSDTHYGKLHSERRSSITANQFVWMILLPSLPRECKPLSEIMAMPGDVI